MSWNVYRRPSEATDSGPEDNAVLAETSQEASAEAQPEAQLKADLDAARAEAESWKDRFLRKAAEFENYRKRADRDRGDAVMFAQSSVLTDFLPVLDACERALGSFQREECPPGAEQYREGVELLYRQAREVLARLGVVPIDSVGQAFDPNIHEALLRVETSDKDENTVIQEFRRGYQFKDRLLRAAQVAVAVRPTAQTPPQA
jgi:molecular chaperone GrpE